MQQQAFLQYANGERRKLSDLEATMCSFSSDFYVIINTPMMVVYRMHGSKPAPVMSYKYGGHGNPKSPVAYRGN